MIISIAPRHLKSICASVLFPAFLLGHDPTRKVVVVSYGGDLAREHAEAFGVSSKAIITGACFRTRALIRATTASTI